MRLVRYRAAASVLSPKVRDVFCLGATPIRGTPVCEAFWADGGAKAAETAGARSRWHTACAAHSEARQRDTRRLAIGGASHTQDGAGGAGGAGGSGCGRC